MIDWVSVLVTVLQYSYFAIGLSLGILLHFLTELKNMKTAGVFMTPKQYWTENPYSTAVAVIGGLIAYMVLVGAGEDNIVYYIMNGYICDSIPKVLGERAGKDIGDRFDNKGK